MDRLVQEVVLGRTGLRVSRLGLGTAPLASVFWGNDEDTAVSTVRRALHRGLTFFDTAPLYGSGLAEHRTGGLLRQKPRQDFVLSTKVGRWYRPAPGGAGDLSYPARRGGAVGAHPVERAAG